MRYLILALLGSSCMQLETVTNQALDTSAADLLLTISNDLQTAKLSRTINATPKPYRLQLHAIINNTQPLANGNEEKDADFPPLAFSYVIFSYLQETPEAEQQTTVYTCVTANVIIGMAHKVQTANCNSGNEALQAAQACSLAEDKHFVVPTDKPSSFHCETSNTDADKKPNTAADG